MFVQAPISLAILALPRLPVPTHWGPTSCRRELMADTSIRIAVSKSKRFEIFNRDGFTCQYCGQRPPDVVLELDHMIAVANGGTNEDLNLITSCYDCNRGKSDKALGAAPPRPDADLHWLQVAQETAEIDRYLKAKKVRDKALKSLMQALEETWAQCLTNKYVPNDKQWLNWLNVFSPDEIESAIRKATRKYQSERNWRINQEYHVNTAIRYVSGILNRVRQEAGEGWDT